jgi:hypothetical protein
VLPSVLKGVVARRFSFKPLVSGLIGGKHAKTRLAWVASKRYHKAVSVDEQAALQAARRMPETVHYGSERPFNIMKSATVNWLVAQPEVRQWLFNWARKHGAIVYHQGRWHGANYQPPESCS